MENITTVKIEVELTLEEAWQLAQFIKRSRFGQYRECSMNDDEAYTMIYALGAVRRSLAEKGYAPR